MNRVQTIKGLTAATLALLSVHANAQLGSTPTASAGVFTATYPPRPAPISTYSNTITDATLAEITNASQFNNSIFSYAGTASADFQTLKAETSGSSYSGVSGDARVTTSFTSGVMTIASASTSPLQFGISLRLDGSANAGFGGVFTGQALVGSAKAGADLKYQIFDLDSNAYKRDNMPLFQFDLSAYAETYQNAQNAAYLSPLVSSSRLSAASVLGSSSPVGWNGGSSTYYTSFDYPNLMPSSSLTFDTGVLSFSTSVLAGHRLVAKATLESYAQGDGIWDASSKFGNTFDAELNLLTAGASLQGYTPGVYAVAAAVPEPETYAMMLAGLGLVGAIVSRRKAKQTA